MILAVEDYAEYEFDETEYTEEEAKSQAWDWFNERKPTITRILDVSDSEKED